MTRWYTEKKREHYYKKAKQSGYRARSAFKLLQINNKFNIIKKDDFVICAAHHSLPARGGYCVGSPVAYRALAGHLAVRCAARVFAADYRLAPEHPFPAAVDDAATAYRGLLATGTAPEHIVIAGDSAGGGLTVAAALRTRELGQPLPRALVLFSPLLDLTFEQIEAPPAGDAVLTLPWLVETARAYVARGNPRHPLASPIGARL